MTKVIEYNLSTAHVEIISEVMTRQEAEAIIKELAECDRSSQHVWYIREAET